MLWVLKRTVSMRQFFWAPITYAKNYGLENIYNFMFKNFVYLNVCKSEAHLYTMQSLCFVLSEMMLYVPVNNFSVMLGQFPVFCVEPVLSSG